MTLTNSKSVALERRMDLASLFCMIGRHGPAVAVAVLAMISVLAAFVIYRRTVRGKRGKATAEAAGREVKSRGEEPDAAVNQEGEEEEEEEEADMIPAESTEVEDGATPDLPKDPDLFQNHLKIRQRCAAAATAEDSFTVLKAVEKKPPLHSSPRCDDDIPEDRHTASGGGQSPEWDMKPHRAAEMYRDEVSQHQHLSEPEQEKEDVFNSHQDVKVETLEDGTEAIHYKDSCLKESTDDAKNQEEEQVFKADYMEVAEDVTTDEGSPHINTRQEEENVQCVMKNLLSKHVGLQDDKTTREEKDSEPINGVNDEHEEERQCPDSTVNANYCRDSNVTAEEEEEKDEGEEEEEEEDECVDPQLIAQQREICPTTHEETHSPSSQPSVFLQQLNKQHDQTDVLDDEGGVTGQVIEDLRDLTAAECDVHLADGQVKDKETTNGDVTACISAGQRDSSSPLLTSLNQTSELEKVDGGDEGLPGVATCPVSSPSQQPQRKQKDVEDEMSALLENHPDQCEKKETGTAAGLAEEQNASVEDPQAPSPSQDQQGGQVINEDFERVIEGVATTPDIDALDATCVTSPTVAAACDDDRVTAQAETEEAPRPQLSSVCHSHLSGLNDEEFDESNVVSDPDTAAWDDGDVTLVVNHEEISCPLTAPVFQNQKRGQTVKNEALDKDTGTETVACDGRTFIIPVIVEDVSCPPLPSFYEDQESGQTRDNEGLGEESVTAGTAAVTCGSDEELSSFLKDQQSSQTVNNEGYTAEEMSPPINHLHSLSFDQSEQRGHDMDNISSPGADEESGVSSMALSPDFEEPSEDLGPPVMDFGHHLIEAHHGIFSKSVTNEDGSIPSMVFVDKAICASFGGNEDVLGQDIEDSYHGEFDHFTAQIVASIGSRTDEPEKRADDKDVDVAEMKEEKEGIRLEKKEKARAENEEDEDYERTEISIMEATMDSNEWIEDINYHVLPWMNLSLKSLDQDHTNTEKLHQDFTVALATTDAVGTDARDVDVQFPSEDKQSSTLSVADDNNKKVAAVPPMPQSVNVTFCVHYLTRSPHQTVAVTGNQQELGSWKGFVPLERAKDGYWAGVIGLPAASRVEWKFVLVDNDEVCRWEECGNRYLETGCGDDLYVHKWWGSL